MCELLNFRPKEFLSTLYKEPHYSTIPFISFFFTEGIEPTTPECPNPYLDTLLLLREPALLDRDLDREPALAFFFFFLSGDTLPPGDRLYDLDREVGPGLVALAGPGPWCFLCSSILSMIWLNTESVSSITLWKCGHDRLFSPFFFP